MRRADGAMRVFKNAWFAKAARKADISDVALCAAIGEVVLGQADNLGGGVFKKRLNRNMHRSIILARAETFWIFAYLFAKKDRSNIEDDELEGFRKLAKSFAALDARQLSALLDSKDLTEICHEDKSQIQE